MLYEYYGKTLNIPDEVFFKLSDNQLDDYIASAHEMEIEDPFFESSLNNITDNTKNTEEEE